MKTTDLDPKVLHMCEYTDYQTPMLKMYKEFFCNLIDEQIMIQSY